MLVAGASLHAAPALPAVAALPAATPAEAAGRLASEGGAVADALIDWVQGKPALPGVAGVARMHSEALVRQVRDTASGLVVSAMDFLGVRYRRGGSSAEQGFDCSGFTRYVFEHSLGLVLPRRADQQAQNAGLLKIGREELRPGDLVFFNTMRRAFSHVGIYVGEGRFIHAPKPGGAVRIDDLAQSYWASHFSGARRADGVGRAGLPTPVEAGFLAVLPPDALQAAAAPAGVAAVSAAAVPGAGVPDAAGSLSTAPQAAEP